MGLERRGRHSYFYRKERQGARVVSVYQGAGEVAEALAALHQIDRTAHPQQQAAFRAERAGSKQQAAIVAGSEVDVRQLVAAVLITNGFYQHKRQWRRRPMQQDRSAHNLTAVALVSMPDHAERRREGFAALRAAMAIEATPSNKRRGITDTDRTVAEREKRAAVRKVLADYLCIWERLSDVLSTGQRSLVEATCGGSYDSATRHIVRKSMGVMRSSLGYETAPPLERMLIEQVVLAWVDLDFVQIH